MTSSLFLKLTGSSGSSSSLWALGCLAARKLGGLLMSRARTALDLPSLEPRWRGGCFSWKLSCEKPLESQTTQIIPDKSPKKNINTMGFINLSNPNRGTSIRTEQTPEARLVALRTAEWLGLGHLPNGQLLGNFWLALLVFCWGFVSF